MIWYENYTIFYLPSVFIRNQYRLCSDMQSIIHSGNLGKDLANGGAVGASRK